MKRKVIQLAGKTFVITLPNSWVREWSIGKGEEVDVAEQGPRLIVSASEPRVMRKGIIEISSASEQSIRWLLSSLHKKGYDEFEIRTSKIEHRALIDELVRDLFLGFAVVHSTKDSCIVRCVSKELEDQLEVVVRRAFLVTLSLAEQCLEFSASRRFGELSSLLQLEKANNQLTSFCERILNKRGLSEPVKTSFLYVILWNLEKIADEYKYLCTCISKAKSIDKASIVLFRDVNVLLRKYYELFYSFDIASLSLLSGEFKELRARIESAMQGKDAVVLSHLHHIVLKCADFSASTFALHD